MGAAKLYMHNVNTDSFCDSSGAPFDLSRVVGGGGNADSAIASTSFVERASWDMNIPEDTVPGVTEVDLSANVTLVSAATSYRFRVQAVNAACAVTASSGYSATFTDAGVKTATLSLTWPQGADRFRLSLEVKDDDAAGSKIVRVRADASSYVVALFIPLMEGVLDAVIARLTAIARASGYHYTLSAEQVIERPVWPDQATRIPAAALWVMEMDTRGPALIGDTARQNQQMIRLRWRCFQDGDSAQRKVMRLQADVASAIESDPPHLGFSSNTIEMLKVRVADPKDTDEEIITPYAIGDVVVEALVRVARGRI